MVKSTKAPNSPEPGKVTHCKHIEQTATVEQTQAQIECSLRLIADTFRTIQFQCSAVCSVSECTKTVQWLCLSTQCDHRALCSSKQSISHSDQHFEEFGHSLQIHVRTLRVWCNSCNSEIKPDLNIPEWRFGQLLVKQMHQQKAQRTEKDKSSNSTGGGSSGYDGSMHSLDVSSASQPVVHRPKRKEQSVSSSSVAVVSASSVQPQPASASAVGRAGRRYIEHNTATLVYDQTEQDDPQLPITGVTGLMNIGNTCYMNAALQTLSHCTPVKEYFCAPQQVISARLQATCSGNQQINNKQVAITFRNLLMQLWSGNRSAVNAHQLLQLVRQSYPAFRGWAQQDSQEFLRCFLELLHSDLKQPVYWWEQRKENDTNNGNSSGHNQGKGAGGDARPQAHGQAGSGNSSAAGSGRSTPSTGDSGASCSDHDLYETADSGCSSDQDDRANLIRAHGLGPRRKRARSENLIGGGSGRAPGHNHNTRYSVSLDNTQLQNSAKQMSVSVSADTSAVTMDTEDTEPILDSVHWRGPLKYRSIITDIFDGRLMSTVKCLTCQRVSTTIETFQDLSLPVPSREQCDRMRESAADASDTATNTDLQTWYWWMWSWLSGSWLWRQQPVCLSDCLKAFFASDELSGDNMYSCEKCLKLRNGEKRCRMKTLPEVLCIHLKRFRHDAMYSSKVSTTVQFPLSDLDVREFVSAEHFTAECTTYNLVAIVTHMGSANGGHYVACCLNVQDNQWYEYDDSYVTQIEAADVLCREAYVLFYKKADDAAEQIRHQINALQPRTEQRLLSGNALKYYVSREWYDRLRTFSEPGPITNHDFLCAHSLIQPQRAHTELADHCVPVTGQVWDYLHAKFGGGPVCTRLQHCLTCTSELEQLKQRRQREADYFQQCERLADAHPSAPDNSLQWCINMSWIRQWDDFVQDKLPVPPGPVDNKCLLRKEASDGQQYLRQNSNFHRLPWTAWAMLQFYYKGGPAVSGEGEVKATFGPQPSLPAVTKLPVLPVLNIHNMDVDVEDEHMEEVHDDTQSE